MADLHINSLLHHLGTVAGPHAVRATDQELLARYVHQRDDTAFTLLVQRHGPMVLGICRRLLQNVHDAEDAFQAAFLVLARRAGAIRNTESLAAWLFGVARRVALRARVEASRRPIVPVRATTAANDPVAATAWRELQQVLDEEIARLPARYRAPLLLCCVEGRSREEAARELGWTLGAVKGRLERGRQLLRRRLVRRGIAPTAVLVGLGLAQAAAGAVPAGLVSATSRAATAGSASAAAAALAEGCLRSATAGRWSVAAGLLLTLAVAGTAASLLGRATPEPEPAPPPTGQATEVRPQVRTDRYGDALPHGAVTRLGTVRFRHEGEGYSVVFSPDGTTLAARTASGATLWDARTGRVLHRLPVLVATTDIQGLLDFSPDGTLLAGMADLDHVGVWDVATGKERSRYLLAGALVDRLGSGLCTLRFAPDGKRIAVATSHKTCVLDAATGRVLQLLKGCVCFAFTPEGRILAQATQATPGEGAFDIELCNVVTGKVRGTLQGLPKFVNAMAFSTDGQTLAAGFHNGIFLWDVSTARVRSRLVAPMGSVMGMGFTPDGRTLVSGGEEDGKVRIWDVATGKEMRQLDTRMRMIRSLGLSRDGRTVAAGTIYSTIRLWDLASGHESFTTFEGNDAPVRAVAYSPDGKLLATGGDNREVALWNPATGTRLRALRGGSASTVAFCAEGSRLATTWHESNVARVLDLASGRELVQLVPTNARWVTAVASIGTGNRLVTACPGKDRLPDSTLHVWDAASGRLLATYSLKELRPDCISVAGDGNTLAVAGASDEGRIIRLWDLAAGREIRSMRGERPVEAVAFSPDARLLATGQLDGRLSLWDVATGREVILLAREEQAITAVAFSPDGRLLASASGVRPRAPQAWVSPPLRLWDALTGKEVARLPGAGADISSLAFAPDGIHLASGLWDSTALIWDLSVIAGAETERIRSLDTLWSDLASKDSPRAFAATWEMARLRNGVVPFLKARLQPSETPGREHLRQLIADLDDDRFSVREAAARQLERLGDQAALVLREALAGKPSPEARKRMEVLLAVSPLVQSPEDARPLRAVQVLERLDTAESLQVLQWLARGDPVARQTREARAALARLRALPSETSKQLPE
jgi:RNA polymerase sigma factor (sigma-70 family)